MGFGAKPAKFELSLLLGKGVDDLFNLIFADGIVSIPRHLQKFLIGFMPAA
jgi:hypothetical protein